MRYFIMIAFVATNISAASQNTASPTLKSILLEQLKTTHNVKDWFVPVGLAIDGLTPQQANWKDSTENHSIAQLTTHLIFWNQQSLAKFKGEKPDAFDGNNKETFSPVNDKTWPETIKKLDAVLSEWERLIEKADETKLKQWYSTIAHIGAHNAYHTGQILYIRKMKEWWNPENGVK
jgi:DinB superfamily